MSDRIKQVVMPKWGLSMREGKVTKWIVKLGDKVSVGDELLEVETEKIASAVEAGDAGVVRRILGEVDTVYPVKTLLAILADEDVPDSEIDAFLSTYVPPVAEEGEEEVSAYQNVTLPVGEIRYAKYGDGAKTLIFIHGFGGDLDNWLFNTSGLADQFTIYAIDLPGHGRSVKAFMDELKIDHANLIGHSLGGAISMKTAIAAPKRVSSVTVFGSAGLGADINMDYINGFISAESRREIKPFLEQLFFDSSLVGRQMIDDILKYKRLDGVPEAFKGGTQAETLADAFKATGIPLLAIHGKDDHIIPVSHTDAVEGFAKVELFADTGHMSQMEKSKEANALIAAHAK
jgi:pyruvate dehydrogenase E2 component (dihydrolipoamide acetyltransferase)